MGWKQTYKVKAKIKGNRGWCLKHVDDAINAPKRTPNAAVALKNERAAKRIRTSTPPKGIWVIGFLDLGGVYANLDHVFLMKYLGKGKYEIRDSEVAAGVRKPYTKISEILAWFGAYNPKYAGWSTTCDGRTIAKYEAPKPAPKPKKPSVTTLAREVIAGKWGNGPIRVSRLKKAGHDPKAVQKKVNELMR